MNNEIKMTREEKAAAAIREQIGLLAEEIRRYERDGCPSEAAHRKIQARRWTFYLVNLKTDWTIEDCILHNQAEQKRLSEKATKLEEKNKGRMPEPGEDLYRWRQAVEDLWLESEIEKILKKFLKEN